MKILVLSVGVVASLAGLAGSAAVAAECAADTRNLLANRNCGFAQDIEGWTGVHEESASHERTDGDPAKGALAGTDRQGSLRLQAPCIPVQPDTDYRIAVRLRIASGDLYVCGYTIFQGDDAACENASEPLVADARPPKTSWQQMSGETRTGATARSVQLRLECSGEQGFRMLFDDVVFAAK